MPGADKPGAQFVFRIDTADAMHEFGVRLAGLLDRGDVVVLTGPLGAGKTTLARGLGEGLGVRGPVSSPTFVIARTHPPLDDGPHLIHVDAYRLRDALDLDDLDLDLDASVTVIEWGRDLVSAIALDWLDIELERPRAGARVAGIANLGAETATGPDAERTVADSAVADSAGADSVVADEGADDLDLPRIVRIAAVGERWSRPGAVAALAEVAGTESPSAPA